jgi:hypothetical protein
VRLGVLLLEPRNVRLLGGRVDALAEAWETQQRYGGTAIERPGARRPLFGAQAGAGHALTCCIWRRCIAAVGGGLRLMLRRLVVGCVKCWDAG